MQFSISETVSIKDIITKMKEEVLDSEDKLRRMIIDNEASLGKYKIEQKKNNDFMLKTAIASQAMAGKEKNSKPPKKERKNKYGKNKSPEPEDEAED